MLRWFSLGEMSLEASPLDHRLKVFRAMGKIRSFRLVLCVDSWDGMGEHMVEVLKQAVAVEKVERGFDDTFPEPLVIHSPRGSCYRGMEIYAPISWPWTPL